MYIYNQFSRASLVEIHQISTRGRQRPAKIANSFLISYKLACFSQAVIVVKENPDNNNNNIMQKLFKYASDYDTNRRAVRTSRRCAFQTLLRGLHSHRGSARLGCPPGGRRSSSLSQPAEWWEQSSGQLEMLCYFLPLCSIRGLLPGDLEPAAFPKPRYLTLGQRSPRGDGKQLASCRNTRSGSPASV